MSATTSGTATPVKGRKRKDLARRMRKYLPFYFMFLPVLVAFLVFSYWPMLHVDIAFYEYGIFGKGAFIGLENFERLFNNPRFPLVFSNTLIMSIVNLVLGMITSIIFALLLNEINQKTVKKTVQTAVYLPHFLSWVIVASLFTMILSPTSGITGPIYEFLGVPAENPLQNPDLWRPLFYFVSVWKGMGWGAIVYLAAITGIDPTLYEAAAIDGAGKMKQTWYITLPAMTSTMLVVLIMNLSKILNLFDSVFNLYNPLVYDVADVLQTYVYRVGLVDGDFGYATAVGLFKSVITLVLVLGANFFSKKVRGRGIL